MLRYIEPYLPQACTMSVDACMKYIMQEKYKEIRKTYVAPKAEPYELVTDEERIDVMMDWIDKAAQKYDHKIRALPEAEIVDIYHKLIQHNRKIIIDKELCLTDGDLDSAAYSFWLACEYWTLEETTLLSVGKNPREVSNYDLNNLLCSKVLNERQVLIERKYGQTQNIKPCEFIQWLDDVNLLYPNEFKKLMCDDSPASVQPINTNVSEKDLGLATRERNTLLKLVFGMAVGGYSYDSSIKRSPAIKDIEDDLLKIGVHVGDDTIRKWLKIANDEVGFDMLEHQE